MAYVQVNTYNFPETPDTTLLSTTYFTRQADSSTTVNINVNGANRFYAAAQNFDAYARWDLSGDNFGDDHYAQITLGNLAGNSENQFGVNVRNDGGTACDCYLWRMIDNTGTNTYLEKVAANTKTTLDSRSIAWTNADTMMLAIEGDTLSCIRNGSVVFTFDDSTITSGGKPGIFAYWRFSGVGMGGSLVVGNVTASSTPKAMLLGIG